jgi:hypothetical protein
MRLPWQQPRSAPLDRLLAAADLTRGTAEIRDDAAAIQRLALTVAHADPAPAAVFAEAERLLSDPAAHPVVAGFLEGLQNVVSFGGPRCVTDARIAAELGPRATVLWTTLHTFWQDVLTWCDDQQVALSPADDVTEVGNETLRALLVATNRRVPGGAGGRRLGLAHAVRYERATGNGIPGFTHLGAVLAAAGRR